MCMSTVSHDSLSFTVVLVRNDGVGRQLLLFIALLLICFFVVHRRRQQRNKKFGKHGLEEFRFRPRTVVGKYCCSDTKI